MNRKKYIAAMLLGATIASNMGMTVFAESIKENVGNNITGSEIKVETTSEKPISITKFKDMNNHWAKPFVARMIEDRLFAGITDTTFEPETAMTETQYLAVAMLSGYPEEIKEYKEKYKSPWYMAAYRLAKDKGIITEKNYGTSPEAMDQKPITREKITDIVIKIIEEKGEKTEANKEGVENKVPDINSCSQDFKDSVIKAYTMGIIAGDQNGFMNPQKTVTRAEGATVLYNFAYPEARKLPDFSQITTTGQIWKEGEKHSKPKEGDIVIKPDGTKVVLKYVEVAPGSNFFVLGYGQGVDIITGTTENGITVTGNKLGGAWLGFQPEGDLSPFVKDPITGEVHTEYEWGQIETFTYPNHKGTYAGEKAGLYFVWDTVIEDWTWTGPTRAAYQ